MIIFLVVLVVLIGICVGLYFFGKKAEKKQAEQKEQMDAVAQTVSMLVIDKKRLKLKEAGLPAAVVENTPKYLRRTRVPIVKAKIGPKIMTLMCEEKVFEVLPVKKEAKVVLSGIYITGIKSVRGGIPEVAKKKKKGLFSRFKKKRTESKKFRSCQSDRSGTFLFFSSYFQISLFSDLLYSPDHSSVITLPNFSFYTLFLPRTPEAPSPPRRYRIAVLKIVIRPIPTSPRSHTTV